jgi:methionine synthase II (cobalamin-independent)
MGPNGARVKRLSGFHAGCGERGDFLGQQQRVTLGHEHDAGAELDAAGRARARAPPRIDESAGDPAVLEKLPPGVRLGVGVVNQKREDVESVADIVAHARRAIDLVGPTACC